jgi:hypothetical protein
MMTRNEYESAVNKIRSKLDYFLQSGGDLDLLLKDPENVISDLINCPGFDKRDTLYAWYPKPTLYCPREGNTSAEITCSTVSACTTRFCHDSGDEPENRIDDDNDYHPSIPPRA